MPRAPAGFLQDLFRPRLNFFPPCEEKHRIKISLDCAFEVKLPPAPVERNSPIKSDDFRARLFHRGKKRRAIGSKIDDRHTGLLQVADQFGGAGKDIAPVVFDAQASYPTVENLDDISARSHLLRGVFTHDRD